jgi:hypothetical protein
MLFADAQIDDFEWNLEVYGEARAKSGSHTYIVDVKAQADEWVNGASIAHLFNHRSARYRFEG